MPVKFYITILFFVSFNIVYSQISPGAKQISLANSDVALCNDVFAVFNNPAGLAQLNWREAGIYYSPAPFGLKEMANAYGSYIEPTSMGNISIGFMTYGFELYRENKFLLSYAARIENNLLLGASLLYHNLSIKNYGSDNAFSLNLGGLAYIRNDLRWGFQYHNISGASYGTEDDQIPSVLLTGLSFDPSEDIILNAAIEKSSLSPLSLKFGIEYTIVNAVFLRGGFSTEPDRFSAGIGFTYSYFELDYSVFNHSDLGLTHQAGILISFLELRNRNKIIKKNLGF